MGRKSLEERIKEVQERWARERDRLDAKKIRAQVHKTKLKPKGKPQGACTVYFFQVGRNGPIKIGRTRSNPLYRRASIQAYLPYSLRILGVIRGVPHTIERRLHYRFWEDRIRRRNEWFRPSEKLLTFIRQNAIPWEAVKHETDWKCPFSYGPADPLRPLGANYPVSDSASWVEPMTDEEWEAVIACTQKRRSKSASGVSDFFLQ